LRGMAGAAHHSMKRFTFYSLSVRFVKDKLPIIPMLSAYFVP
jgi:hypothetical protein